mmetsp:Transcript_19785/g.33769  ORF Transcript_19785/g.33769 Transcript_19785/m.33769 type:complete len:136 (-) Transcript_19785:88-495(-)
MYVVVRGAIPAWWYLFAQWTSNSDDAGCFHRCFWFCYRRSCLVCRLRLNRLYLFGNHLFQSQQNRMKSMTLKYLEASVTTHNSGGTPNPYQYKRLKVEMHRLPNEMMQGAQYWGMLLCFCLCSRSFGGASLFHLL